MDFPLTSEKYEKQVCDWWEKDDFLTKAGPIQYYTLENLLDPSSTVTSAPLEISEAYKFATRSR